jgi:hypothetical protein
MCQGIGDELGGIDLGDKRLNQRSVKVLEALARDPQASINAAISGWGDTLAAYRFFDNDHVSPAAILAPHRQAALARMREHEVVLIVQDTTELDFTGHPADDALCLNTDTRFGLYYHPQLALTPEQLPLGVVGAESYAREPESLGKAASRGSLPIEEKESLRWLNGYRSAHAAAAECPATQVISVADCEADIYDVFLAAREVTDATPQARRAEFIIRAKEPRQVLASEPAGTTTPRPPLTSYKRQRDESHPEVRAAVAQSRLLKTYTAELSETPKRKARTATLEVRALTVTLKPPSKRSRLPPLTVNYVLVQEIHGPGDDTDVSWLLITTLPIATVAEVMLVVSYYLARWGIEVFFRTLKTGCQVEEVRLETTARLKNCLAMYSIIAWRILYLTYLNRATPDLPCDTVFTEAEWKSVYQVTTKKSPPPTAAPRLDEFLRLLTSLGGYNNRATERPSGPLPIWLGLRRMLDFAIAWQEFGPKSCV